MDSEVPEVELTEEEKQKQKEDELCKELYYKSEVEGIKQSELAKEYGLSAQQTHYRVKKGRKLTMGDLNKNPEEIRADIVSQYDYIWKQAQRQYLQTQDLNTLKLMSSILEAKRKIFSIDAPTKAPVNDKGETAQNNQLVLVFDDSNYKAIEQKYQKQISGDVVEGKVTEI